MSSSIKEYTSLFKLRVCSLITFSAVVGFVSAPDLPQNSVITIVMLCLLTMMASMGASAFNHYFDTDIDSVMKRTKRRPIPSGAVEDKKWVLAIAAILFLTAVFFAVKLLNPVAGLHLFLGGFTYSVLYTVWLKRSHWSNIIIGGLAGSFAVLAGGASASPEFCLTPVLLSIVMFFWTPSHFWSFAIVHRNEYEKAGVPMLPNVIGDYKTAVCILINTVILVLSSFLPVYYNTLGFIYAITAIAVGTFFIVRNIQLLKETTREMAWKNFKASMTYLGLLFLAVIADVAVL